MAEPITVARPYAEAAYALARDGNALPVWSETLRVATAVVSDPHVRAALDNPRLATAEKESLLLSIFGDKLEMLLGVLADAGWDWVHDRAATLAASLAAGLAERGLEVGPRDRSTLVAWKAEDAQAEVERLGQSNFIVRSIPAFGLVRASVGAWSSEEELDALVDAAVA